MKASGKIGSNGVTVSDNVEERFETGRTALPESSIQKASDFMNLHQTAWSDIPDTSSSSTAQIPRVLTGCFRANVAICRTVSNCKLLEHKYQS